ncbi:putative protein S-acyltransferase 14 [Datura stramonium]|uniref:S-acyltransferase n=1 Tax=Datura stramonium TaxID=4076 RepID=A0ABS8W394_DATST|nr:putative protein S-acyltransferase 14 [Datura stramonium]
MCYVVANKKEKFWTLDRKRVVTGLFGIMVLARVFSFIAKKKWPDGGKVAVVFTRFNDELGGDFYGISDVFVFYTFLETTVVTLSLLPQFIAFFSDGEIPGNPGTLATTFLAFVLNLAFALSVLGFLIMHISLVSANTTTIEAYEKKTSPKWRYDLGRKRNFEQVFGMDKRYWFIPAYSEEDLRRIPALHGLEYPSKPDLDAQE